MIYRSIIENVSTSHVWVYLNYKIVSWVKISVHVASDATNDIILWSCNWWRKHWDIAQYIYCIRSITEILIITHTCLQRGLNGWPLITKRGISHRVTVKIITTKRAEDAYLMFFVKDSVHFKQIYVKEYSIIYISTSK